MRLLSCAFLAALSFGLASPARAEWHEAKSDHFIIYADQSPTRTRDFALELERFDSSVRQLMGMPNPRLTDAQRVIIFVVPDIKDVSKLSGVDYAAGFYTSRVEGSQAFVPSSRGIDTEYARVILYHEYTHHLQLQNADHPIPMWISEGFADFTSTAAVNRDGSVTFGKQAPGREWNPNRRSSLSMRQIVGETFTRLDDRDADDLYARSWQLVSYMLGDETRRAQLNAYIADIGKGDTPADAASKAFGEVDKLDRRLQDYAMSNSLHGFKVSPEAIRVGPVAVRQLTPGEAAIMDVRIRSTAGVNEKTAPIVEAEAKQVAARFPADGPVQSRLAEAAFDAKDYVGSAAAANKALAANPNDVHALTYRAWTSIRSGMDKPETVNWESVRADLIRANKLDTENPLPLYLYFQSFPAARHRPSSNAIDALLYAMTLAPRDTGVRMNAVQELLVENKLAEAKNAFRFIAYSPHQSASSRAWSQKVLDAIDRGDGKGALAAMRSDPKAAGSEQ